MKCDDREVLTWLARTTRILLRRVELLESRRYKHRDESYSRHVPLELPNASSGVLPRIVLCLDDLVANSACSQELSGEEQALDRADKVLDASGTFEFSADAAAFIPGGTAEAHLPDDAHVFGFDIHSQRLCLDEALPILADASVRALAPDDVADPTSKLGSATRHLNIGDVKGDEHNFEVALEPPSSAEARLAATKRNPANARRVKDLIDDFDLGREVHAALLLMDVALLGELLDCEADLRHRLQGLPDTAARIQKTLWLIDMTDEAVKGLLGVEWTSWPRKAIRNSMASSRSPVVNCRTSLARCRTCRANLCAAEAWIVDHRTRALLQKFLGVAIWKSLICRVSKPPVALIVN